MSKNPEILIFGLQALNHLEKPQNRSSMNIKICPNEKSEM